MKHRCAHNLQPSTPYSTFIVASGNIPSSSISENEPLFKHISDLCSGSSPVVILGDFNLPDINWNTLSGNSSLANVFCELVFELNLLQLIECPTHIHGNILDLILTNTDDLIQNVIVLPHNRCPVQSDHFLINFSMSISEHSHRRRKRGAMAPPNNLLKI